MNQLILPGLPEKLAKSAQRYADRCDCWRTHQAGLAAEPCFCDCHVEPWPSVDEQMRKDNP